MAQTFLILRAPRRPFFHPEFDPRIDAVKTTSCSTWYFPPNYRCTVNQNYKNPHQNKEQLAFKITILSKKAFDISNSKCSLSELILPNVVRSAYAGGTFHLRTHLRFYVNRLTSKQTINGSLSEIRPRYNNIAPCHQLWKRTARPAHRPSPALPRRYRMVLQETSGPEQLQKLVFDKIKLESVKCANSDLPTRSH